MLSINKPLCTLKRTEYGTQSPVSGNPLTVLGLHVLLLFSSIQVATGQGTAMGSALVPPSTDCEQPVVVAVSTAQETACGNQDGKISIQVQDEEQDATYTVILTQEKKQVQYSSLSAPNGMVKISNLVPAGFTGIQIVREQDGCASAFFDEPFLIKPACLPANTRNTTCGGGVFPHQNCEGQTIYINGNNIAPQTFIYLDDDYLGCIGYVNSNCQIEQEEGVYCGDHQLTEPTPNNGYDYGDVVFTKETGLVSNLGISELEAERINWIMCNGPAQGYSKSDINQAIWHFSSGYSNCNALCQAAEGAVNTVQGGIDSQMEVYMPQSSNIQPFIVNSCACVASVDGLFVNDYNGDNNVLEITNGAMLDLNTLPANFRLEADVSGFVGSVRFTITGDDNSTNVENSAPYNAPGGSSLWNPIAGNYTVNVKVYSLPNAVGVLCAEETISFSIFPGGTPPVPTTPAPDTWAYDCDDNVTIDFYGSGANCSDNPDAEVIINNTAGVFQTVVEVVYKNQYPGSEVVVTAGGTNYILPEVDISGTSSSVYVYRGLIAAPVGSVSHNTETSGCGSQNGLQSLTAYAFRNTTIKRASSGEFTELSGFCDLQTFSIAIPTDDQERDLSILLPISELTDDGRFMTIRANAGGVTGSTTIFGPDGDCCQAAPVINLQNVPGSVSSVTIDVDTRSSQNPNGSGCGQSWVIAGLTYVDVDCPEPLSSDYGDAPDSYGSICYYIDDANPTRLGATVDSDDNFQSSANADGDDNDGNNDDDGVTFANPSGLTAGASESVTVTWSTNDNDSYISAWIDFNQNGTFDANEKVIDDFEQGAFNNTSTGAESFTFMVPADAVCGTTFARFIITSDPNEGPTGDFCNSGNTSDDGEVEDYQVTILSGLEAEITGSDVVCSGGTTTLTASGGTAFIWNTGETTASINVGAGNYSVTVTNNSDCSDAASFAVSESDLLEVGVFSTDAGCTINNGTVAADPFGGTAPYSYSWNNGATTSNLTGLSAGIYTVTVTDANGCTATGQAEVGTATGPLANIECVDDPVVHRTASNSSKTCGTLVYGFYTGNMLNNWTSEKHWTISDTDFKEYSNGTAVMNATAVNKSNANLIFHINVVFAGRTYATPSGSPKESTQCVGNLDNSDWYYYTITKGNMAGAGDLAGAQVSFDRAGPSFQVGTGANLNDAGKFGASGWLNLNINSQPANGPALIGGAMGDFNINLSGATLPEELASGCLEICVGESVELFANATAGTPGYTYQWSTGSTSAQITVSPTQTATYSLTVTDANGCTDVATATVTVNDPPSVTANGTDATCGESNGSAEVVASGNAPFTYDWSTGATTAVINNLSVGTYTVTVTDANGCQATASTTISDQGGPTLAISATDVDCFGASTGGVSLTVNGGTAPFSYEWSNGATTEDLDNVAAGTYSVTVTDNNGCEATASTMVSEPPALSLSISGEDVDCFGNATGSADLSVSGGTAPYTYAWSNNATTQNIDNLAAGTYEVTVTDANNCEATKSVTINEPSALSLSISGEDVDCFGNATGSADLSVSGGTAPYTYAWSNNATAQNIDNLTAGTYEVTVTDANGCEAIESITINEPTELEAGATSVSSTCGAANGSVTATATGGTMPYTYVWSTGDQTAMVSGLMAGTYTVTVTDANNCTAIASTTIVDESAPELVIVPTSPDCFEKPTGSVDLTVNGGTAPFTFMWSNNATTEDLNNVAAGNYSVTVTDNNGCEATIQTTVTQPEQLELSIAGQDVDCFGNATGAADLTVTGGTTPYTYAWSNNATTQDITDLVADTYSVTVTDANGCQAFDQILIEEPAVLALTIMGEDVDCFGNATGSANLEVTGGTAPYTYIWSNGAITEDINGLLAGNYEVTVTDANGCAAEETVVIDQPDNLTAITGSVASTCGDANGSVSVDAAGGTEPYTYNWSNGGTKAMVTDLLAGDYFVTVTDANGCQTTSSTAVQNIGGPQVMVNSPSACPDEEVSLTASVSGGTTPFTFEWETSETTASITVSTGTTATYTVTVTDGNGCEAVATGTVTIFETPVADAGEDTAICLGESQELIASVTNGTAPYTYLWSTNETTAEITVNPTVTTTYQVTVTDNNGCEDIDEVMVTVNPLPVADAGDDVTVCLGQSVSLMASGMNGTAPYTYTWSTNATTAGITVTPTETTDYFVTVTDANGCIDVDMVTVTIDPNQCASIGDFVWEDLDRDGVQDSGEPGIEGVPVSLQDENGVEVGTTATDMNGFYQFTGLIPGDYQVQFGTPTGFNPTLDNVGDDAMDSDAVGGISQIVTVNNGDNITTIDAGFYAPASIGDFVFLDENGNGLQDSGEPGVSGVTVSLTDAAGNPVTDADGNAVSAITTGTDGLYSFTNLIPGDYIVNFNNPNATQELTGENVNGEADDEGSNDSDANFSTGNSDVVTLTSGENEPDIDAGYFPLQASVDIEKATNGQDADTPEQSVIVFVPTDDNRQPTGEATVTWTYVVTNTGNTTLVDLEVVDDQEGMVGTIASLAPGESETFMISAEAGLWQYMNLATVTGQPVGADGNPVLTTVTDEDPSHYIGLDINIEKTADKTEICAGEEVTFTLTTRLIGGAPGIELCNVSVDDSNLPDDLMPGDAFFIGTDADGDGCVDFMDEDGDGVNDEEFVWVYTVVYNETTTNIASDMADVIFNGVNTGMTIDETDEVTITVNQDLCASIGDYVWSDLDADGIQDSNEPGIEGAEVKLLDADDNVLETTSTDFNGFYSFTELTPGDYKVMFTTPTGFTASPDNEGVNDEVDSDAVAGMTGIISLETGETDNSNDAGFVAPPVITLDKSFVSAVQQPDGSFDVTYQVTVENTGGITTYDLEDTPGFDDDITINSASFTSDAPGNTGGTLSGSVYSLAEDQIIGNGVSHVYNILVNVGISMTDQVGNNTYTGCGSATGTPQAGEGLFNLAGLDLNNDGTPEFTDQACGDLPAIELEKNFISAVQQSNGVYTVTYEVSVANSGGAAGAYDLLDTPGFDDDITITGAAYTSNAAGNTSGTLTGNGPWTLADDQSIAANTTHLYTLTVNIAYNVSDGQGDDIYTACGATTGTPQSGEGLFNEAEIDLNNDGTPEDTDEDCGDLQLIDLELTKVVDNATPNVGEEVTFTVTVENQGPSDATGVAVRDNLPSGYTFVSSNGAYNDATGIWTIGGLANGASVSLEITASVNATGDYFNVAEVSEANEDDIDSTPDNDDGDQSEDDEDSAETTPNPIIDLELTKVVDNATPNVGEEVTFTVTVENQGPSDATGVAVRDNLPSGYTFVSSNGAYDDATGIWTIGDLANGASVSLEITASVNATGDYFNVAEVSEANEDDTDSTPDNDDGDQSEDDEDSAETTPNPIIDLELTKVVDNATPNVGEEVTFTVTVENQGPSDATGVAVRDNLPSGYTFVSSNGAYNDATGIWTIGDLANGASVSLEITASVNATGDYFNVAEVSEANEDDTDSTPDNDDGDQSEDDEDSAETDPNPIIDLELTKVVDNATPNVGEEVTFTVTVENQGPSDATGVAVRDNLPSGYTFVSSNGAYDDATGIWTIGDLAMGASVSLEITASVNATGDYFNVAEVSEATEDDTDS
ncbi:SdrD B-like domain-containing protein, partial [Phaeodactylibacter xiamenensis]